MITNFVADFCERTLFLFTGFLILRTFNYLFFLSFQDISWSVDSSSYHSLPGPIPSVTLWFHFHM